MQLEGDGEREPVPRAVVRCSGLGADVPRLRLGNGRPVVEREARGDLLLVGDIADTYNSAE